MIRLKRLTVIRAYARALFLRERATSAEYWATVAQAIPDYRLHRERLKSEGVRIDL